MSAGCPSRFEISLTVVSTHGQMGTRHSGERGRALRDHRTREKANAFLHNRVCVGFMAKNTVVGQRYPLGTSTAREISMSAGQRGASRGFHEDAGEGRFRLLRDRSGEECESNKRTARKDLRWQSVLWTILRATANVSLVHSCGLDGESPCKPVNTVWA